MRSTIVAITALLEFNQHPWAWVNEPQHGSAVQAIASVIGSLAALFALLFSAGAYVYTRQQVLIAKEQTDIARKQFKLAEETARQERESNRRREIFLFEQKRAEEDVQRPRLRTSCRREAGAILIKITNIGPTAALEFHVTSDNGVLDFGTQDVFRSNESWNAMPRDTGGDLPVFRIEFRTTFGSRWTIRQSDFTVSEEVLDVQRTYALPPQ